MKSVASISALVKKKYVDDYAKIRYMAVLAKLMQLEGPVVIDCFDLAHAGALVRCEAHVICMNTHISDAFINGEQDGHEDRLSRFAEG